MRETDANRPDASGRKPAFITQTLRTPKSGVYELPKGQGPVKVQRAAYVQSYECIIRE
jgi:hypothetical protein